MRAQLKGGTRHGTAIELRHSRVRSIYIIDTDEVYVAGQGNTFQAGRAPRKATEVDEMDAIILDREFPVAKRGRDGTTDIERASRLADANPDGWKQHTTYHWQRKLNGYVLDFWPTTGRFSYRGRVMTGDIDGFIKRYTKG